MTATFLIKIIIPFFLLPSLDTEREFKKEYFDNGALKGEGWVNNNLKDGYWVYFFNDGATQKKGHYYKGKEHGYWYFYNLENKLLKEGHFNDGWMHGWWTFYENETQLKVTYNKNKRDGFGLIYSNTKLIKAIKFEKDKKVGEWLSLKSFRRDNPQVQF